MDPREEMFRKKYLNYKQKYLDLKKKKLEIENSANIKNALNFVNEIPIPSKLKQLVENNINQNGGADIESLDALTETPTL